MFKSRRKQAEEEAKLDPNYRPTSELEPDVEPEEGASKPSFPVGGVIIISVLSVLLIACLIVLLVLKK